MPKPKLRPAEKPSRKARDTKISLFVLEPRIMLDAAAAITLNEGFNDTQSQDTSELTQSTGDARTLQNYLQEKVSGLENALTAAPVNSDDQNIPQAIAVSTDLEINSLRTTSAPSDAQILVISDLESSFENTQHIHYDPTLTFTEALAYSDSFFDNAFHEYPEFFSIDYAESGSLLENHLVISEPSFTATNALSEHNEVNTQEAFIAEITTQTALGAFELGDTDTDNIYFIDTSINGFEAIVDAIPDDAEIVFIDSTENGLDVILSTLEGRSEVGGIHIFSHGDAGELSLGNIELTTETITGEFADELALIGSFLSNDADLFIYGCNFAAGPEGEEAANALALITGADIAASTDLTGSARLEGNWTLEFTTGEVDHSEVIAATDFQGLLQDPVPLSFQNATLISGTDGAIGAVYEYQNVTTGVDARITITDIVGGASLGTIDNDGAGVPAGFQPQITIAGGSPGNPTESYIEFDIAFFQAGTTNEVEVTFNASAIDVDGNSINNREFFEIQGATLQTVEQTTDVSTSFDASTGFIRVEAATPAVSPGINPDATDFSLQSGLDNVTSFTVRIGGISEGAAQTRLTSLSFDEIDFTNPVTTRIGNTAPEAQNDSLATRFDITVNGDLFINNDNGIDRDLQSDPFSITAVNGVTASVGSQITLPSGALLTVNADGTYSYDPNGQFDGLAPGATATDSFTYTITDSVSAPPGGSLDPSVTALSDTATVTITISGPGNVDPIARNDAFSGASNGVIISDVFAANGGGPDNDPDGGTIVIDQINGSPAGIGTTITLASGALLTLNTDGTFFYDPNGQFNFLSPGVADTDSFTYRISDGQGGFDTATVTLTIVGENAPVGQNASFTATEDGAAVNSTVTATDADGDLDPNGFALTSDVNEGTLTFNPDGSFSFDPGPDFQDLGPGESRDVTFTYTATDTSGNQAVPAIVTITVNGVNDNPDAIDDSATTTEDTAVTVDVLANDTDLDGDPLTIDSVTQGANGTVTINADGTLTYTPGANFSGNDSFTYTITDGNGGTDTATVMIVVTPVNDNPDAIDDSATTTEDTAVTVNVLANDTDLDGDPLTIDSVTQGANGTVTINADGTLTYTPGANFSGNDSFTYTITDGNGGTDTATVMIVVTPVNDNPDTIDDSATTTEDTAVTVDVLANDTDLDGDPLTIDSVTQGANGTVTINADGTLTYTPGANFSGNDSFTYTITDGNGGTDTATVMIVVTPVNDNPDAIDDSATTTEDTAVTVNVLANDTDLDGDPLTIDSVTQGANGTVTINADGTLTYTPGANFSGNDSFTYTITDGNGGTDTATVMIVVTPVNDNPDTIDDSATTTEDTAVTVNVLANDTDLDGDPLTIDSVTQGANGTVTINADGTLTYTPGANFSGNDSFTYTITDANGGTDTATVMIVVTPVNDNPDTIDDSATTTEDTAVTVNVLANDTDLDGDPLTIDSVTQGANGTVTINADGTLTYTPGANFSGNDSFTYTITDANGGTDTATVMIVVTPVNDNPDTIDDSATTTEDTAVTVNVLANDTDLDGDPLTIDSVTQGANGTVTINADGTLTYTPGANFSGNDSFTYTITDGNGGTDTATVMIVVTPVNDNPDATDDSATTTEDTAVTVNVLANDTDLDGDPLTIDSVTQGANGTVTINADGTLTYTPGANFTGNDSFTYTITDGNGGTDTATVMIVVTPVNDNPDAIDDSATTTEDTAVTVNVLANDTDLDGDPLTIDSVTQGANGTVTINADGTLTYTPGANFSGNDSFTYTITDGNGGTDTATVMIVVTPVNDNPDTTDDSATTTEDTAVTVDVLANDTDLDGDPLTIDSVTQGANGTVTINADGTLTYTPGANFSGNDSFTYTITDGNGGTDTATVMIVVTPVNDNPDAIDDSATTTEDTAVTVDVLANDTDLDGDPLTIDSVTQGANGTVTINADGTLTYTPGANFTGNDSFTYTITDGNGGTDTATVMIVVTPVNDNPDAIDDSATTTEDTAVTVDVLANDTDLDGDPLTIDSVTQGANGTVTINADGTLTYTPGANFSGNDSFTYTITDGNGGTDTATVMIVVTPVNDNPDAIDDSATTTEDTAVTVDVLANDTDLDGDPLTIDSVTQGANGTVTINADGTLTYTPGANFTGNDSFTYTITDGNGGTDTATVMIVVTPVNDNPDAIDDSATTTEDTAVTVNVLANDTDLDGDPLTIDSVTQGANGTVTINADGTLTYTPGANFTGNDSFTYTITDGNGGTDTATVMIVVTPVNDNPDAIDDSATTTEDTAVTVDVLANDTDLDGDPLTIDSVTQGANGTVTINADGTLTYTPGANFSGNDSFTYTITDGNGGTDTATVMIVVTPVNDNPDAIDDSATTTEDTAVTVNVLANDTDLDGDPLTIDSVTQGANGTVTINADGTLTYTPGANFSGNDSFTYTITDGNGGTDTATVMIVVTPVNDNPDAIDDSATTTEDTAVTVNVLANDTDLDGDPLTIDSVTQGANGTVTINADGTLTYTPGANFSGNDSFTYTITDGNGGTDTATVMIVVTPVNDNPDAIDDSATTTEDTAVTVNVLANDTDLDGDPLTIDSVTQGANGTVTINADGTLTYTPGANFTGNDSFTYTITDGNGGTDTATVMIVVTPVNDNPDAIDDSATTTEDTAVTVNVLANDTDLDGDPLTIDSVTQGANGTVTINADGTLTYTPGANFTGNDSFTYTITDGNGGTDTATVMIVVTPVNDNPDAIDDSATTTEDTAVTVNVLANDTDLDGDPLTIDSVTQGANGTVTINADGTLTYTPGANFSGNDSFTYTITDGNGGTDTATVMIVVTPVNDNPDAIDDSATTTEDTAVTVNVLANDTDLDGDPLTIDSVTQGANGTVTINADGTLTYTPGANFSGNDSFTYTITDGNGGTDTATVMIVVTPVNDNPDAIDDSATTTEDTAVTVNVLANDTDLDGDPLTIDSVTQGANGTVTINADGTLTYTPGANFTGNDSFTYTITDGNGGTDTATVMIVVTPVNDNPDTTDDSATTTEDTAVTVNVLANDTDLDGDPLTIDSVTQGANGTVTINADGTLTYTPGANFSGNDSFTYTITDGNGGTDTATVMIVVTPVNDNPDAIDDSATTTEDTAVTVNVLANDTDLDGDPLTIDSVTQGANGTVTINADGTLTYTPGANFSGNDSFTYTITDGNGGTDTATVMIVVTPVNDNPDAIDDSATTTEDTAVTVNVLANDTDLDGDPLTIDSVTQGANGTVTINADGTLTYTPGANFSGNDSFTYTITDGNGGTDTATVMIVVTPVNDNPDAIDDSATTTEDTAVTVNVLANDTDLDGDPLTIDSVTQGANGTVTINADGTLTYTPGANFSGNDSFTYTITDGNGGTDTATVMIVVTPVNDNPDAIDDSATTTEDTAVTVNVLANDTDLDGDPLTIDSVTQGANGTVTINADGTLTYTPGANFSGNDSFTYTITDGNGGTDTATVMIVVTPVNDNPDTIDDSATTTEDTAVTVDVLANDTDLDGDPLTIDSVTQGANGTVTINADGTLTYTPGANFSGNDSFTYTITDGNGGTDTATVMIVVTPVNDNPDAIDDSATTTEDTAVTVNVLANDTDLDGDPLTIDSVTQGANGTVTINADGTLTYTPGANFSGNDSFTYTITDGNGGTDTATVMIVVTPVNDNPDAIDDSATTTEDTAVTVNVLANDTDLDGDPLTIDSVTQGANGTVTINADGTLTYTPGANFSGNDSFTYTITDGNGGTDTATVMIVVTPVNDNPDAIDDSATTTEDTAVTVDVLANDTDLDGDPLTIDSVTQGANGTVTINADGTLTYTPGANFSGNDSFTYTITDGNGGTDTATVMIVVTPVNDNPDAIDDSATTTEDTAVTVNVLANDTDLDGDPLTIDSVTQGANGTVTINADGTLTYTPGANFSGNDSFTYTITDGNGGTDTATVMIVVTPVNDNPDAIDDSATTTEDTAVTVNVLANDTDLDGDPLTIDSVTQGANGTVTINADGTLTYTPGANFSGNDSFTYTITDGNGGTDTATVMIVVTPVNDNPDAIDDSATTTEDTAVTVNVLANDTDLDGDPLTIDSVTQGANGTVTINADGTLTYTPGANFSGNDSFTYTITDGNGGTDTATVMIVVTPVNDNPDAIDDSATTTEDTAVTVNVLANDTDLDGDPLTIDSVTQGANGTVTINADGTLTYTPGANFSGNDSFTYTITDGNGGTDTATVMIVVTPVNDNPDAIDDSATTTEDTAVTVNVLANDTDLDGDPLTIDSVTQGANGTVTINADGTLTYTPGANFSGNDSFTYTITDGNGGTDTATVMIVVTPVNDNPDAIDDSATTTEDTAVTVNVLANDTDLDGDPLTIDSVTQGANGTVTINADGTLTYTPGANFSGNDSFTYTITDGNGGTDTATVMIVVTPVNDNPDAIDDSATTTEDTAVTVNVLANDTDLDGDPLTIDSVTQGANGTVTINADGTLTYTPGANFSGNDSFTYTITDGNGGTDTATVMIVVTPVNDNPDAIDDSATTTEDTAVTVNVLANDTDLDGDPLTIDSVTQGANGTVTINADGTLTYTPGANFSGNDSFTYTITDGNGGTDTATVMIVVTPVNDNPDAIDDSATTTEDTAVTVNVLANDTDLDGDPLTIDSVTQGANGTVTINADGTLTYTPGANFTGNDSFTYTITDGNGGTDTATVMIVVTPVNDNPDAIDDSATTTEDTAVTVNVLANDTDLDGDPLTIDSVTQGANGTVTINADGTLTYTPGANFSGNDSFTYTITDGNGGTDTATVMIVVTPVNDNPDAIDDSATTTEDTAVTVNVLANDTDLDGDPLTIDSVTQGANGTVTINADGTLTYTPGANFSGNDSFTYTITDGNGGTDTATVMIVVTPVNDNPDAIDDSATTTEDTAVTVNVLANDTDLDGDPLTIDSVTQGANGTVTINADGTLTYTPGANFSGNDSFTYTITDGNGGTDTATVMIVVTPVNDNPDAIDDSATTTEDTAVTVNVLANDTDLDGDPLTIDSVTQGANGTVTINADGTLTYTPGANFTGNDSFTYTITDGNGGTDTATVMIVVTPVNDNPDAIDDSATTTEDTAVTVDVLANDTDLDGDPLTIDSVTQGANGTVTINADGTLTYTPGANFSGNDSFTYTITDGNGGTDTATVMIVVTPVNDNPDAIDDSATTTEDTAVTVNVLANDTDLDGDPLTIDSVTQGANGTVTINADGTLTYTPGANFSGNDSFTYTITDGNGGTDTATVMIVVTPVNDNPDTIDDSATTTEDTAVTVDVLANDTDLDGDPLTIDSVTQGANGTVTINADGTLTYTPGANFSGNDSFTYTITDGNGGTDTATVMIVVTPVNDNPDAIDDSATTTEDTAVTVNVLANDTDLDGDPLTIDSVTQGANGTVTINADGTLTYTPGANFSGNDSFTYTITDGNGGTDTATVMIVVTPVNDNPDAIDDSATTTEDTAVTVNVLANDTDLDGDPLTIDSVTQGANGTVTINADGTLTYTPGANFTGNDSFTYTITDGNGGTDTATVMIVVTPVNDNPANQPPIINEAISDLDIVTEEDSPFTGEISANDPDGDMIVYTINPSDLPQNGTVTINPDTGLYSYIPNEGFNGTDSFIVTVSDGNGDFDTVAVTITVLPVNNAVTPQPPVTSPPVAQNDSSSTDENVPVTVNVLSNDSDSDSETISIVSAVADTGTVAINQDGTLTFTPVLDFTGLATITYTITDPQGNTATAIVTIDVLPLDESPEEDIPEDTPPANDDPVNNSPVIDGDASDITITINENQAFSGQISASDPDADSISFTVSPDDIPSNGSVSLNAATGLYTYTPLPGFTGSDSFTVTVADGQGGFDSVTVTITVVPVVQTEPPETVNAAPNANDDTAETTQDTPITIRALDNDNDPDGDLLTITDVNVALGEAVINADNTITYTPPTGFAGIVTITYTITDGQGGTDTATVQVNVAAPVIVPQPDNEVSEDVVPEEQSPAADLIFLTGIGREEIAFTSQQPVEPFMSIAGNRYVLETVQTFTSGRNIEGAGPVRNTVISLKEISTDPLDSARWGLEFSVENADSEGGVSRSGRPIGDLQGSSMLWEAIAQSGEAKQDLSLLKLDTLIRDGRIYVTIRNGNALATLLQTITMLPTGANTLPEWISDAGDGLYIIDPPVDVETAAFRIIAGFEGNSAMVQEVSIDLQNGHIQAGEQVRFGKAALTFDEQAQQHSALKSNDISNALGRL